MEKILNVKGMMCANCQKHVHDALLAMDGVSAVDVNLEKDLPTLLIVSQAAIHEGTDSGMKTERDDLTVAVAAAEGEKCERCWNYDPTVGKDPDHPTLCHRCIEVLSD